MIRQIPSVDLPSYDIEEMAEQIIRDYYRDEASGFFPIEIEYMAIDYFLLKIRYEKLSDDGSVLGITAYKDTEVTLWRGGKSEVISLPKDTVLIEERLKQDPGNMGRLRFTLAHECSHCVFNRLYPSGANASFRRLTNTVTINQCDRIEPWSEQLINKLAAALLMPFPLIIQAVRKFGLKEIDLYEDFNDYMEADDTLAVMDAAAFLLVSRQALTIRLKQLEMTNIHSNTKYRRV